MVIWDALKRGKASKHHQEGGIQMGPLMGNLPTQPTWLAKIRFSVISRQRADLGLGFHLMISDVWISLLSSSWISIPRKHHGTTSRRSPASSARICWASSWSISSSSSTSTSTVAMGSSNSQLWRRMDSTYITRYSYGMEEGSFQVHGSFPWCLWFSGSFPWCLRFSELPDRKKSWPLPWKCFPAGGDASAPNCSNGVPMRAVLFVYLCIWGVPQRANNAYFKTDKVSRLRGKLLWNLHTEATSASNCHFMSFQGISRYFKVFQETTQTVPHIIATASLWMWKALHFSTAVLRQLRIITATG